MEKTTVISIELLEAIKDVLRMWPVINKNLPQETDAEQGQSQAIFVAFHNLESTLKKDKMYANTKPLNDEILEAMGFTEEYHYWHLGEFKLTKEDDGLAFSHNGKLIQYTHELYELGVKAKED